VNSKRRIISALVFGIAVYGYPRSMILVTIELTYVTSYNGLIVTLALSLIVS